MGGAAIFLIFFITALINGYQSNSSSDKTTSESPAAIQNDNKSQ